MNAPDSRKEDRAQITESNMPEPKKISSGEPSPTPPEPSPEEAYINAKRHKRQKVNAALITYVRERLALDGIGGSNATEDPEALAEGLHEFIQSFPKGLPLPYAKIGYDDPKLFKKIREALIAAGKIKEVNRGASTYLVPITEEEAATE